MKIGILLRYTGQDIAASVDLVREAESLGYESVWTAESWGTDAITPAAWMLASTTRIKVGTGIMQMSARTPAMAAMTAMTLQAMSGNRFVMGIGPSGPQVIEGWHGEPFGKPLLRTREYVEIVRKILARKGPLEHHGEHYRIPYDGPGATGLGKPLKPILHGDPSLKIVTASFSPAGLRTAAEVADGVLPIWQVPEKYELIGRHLDAGFAKAGGGKSLENFDVMPFVRVAIGDDIDKCRRSLKENFALYIGGMGARDKNFYNDYVKRLGYEEAAVKIQDLFLTGRRKEAMDAVPDDFVDAVSLVGPRDVVRERLKVWKQAAEKRQVSQILLGKADRESLRIVAEEAF